MAIITKTVNGYGPYAYRVTYSNGKHNWEYLGKAGDNGVAGDKQASSDSSRAESGDVGTQREEVLTAGIVTDSSQVEVGDTVVQNARGSFSREVTVVDVQEDSITVETPTESEIELTSYEGQYGDGGWKDGGRVGKVAVVGANPNNYTVDDYYDDEAADLQITRTPEGTYRTKDGASISPIEVGDARKKTFEPSGKFEDEPLQRAVTNELGEEFVDYESVDSYEVFTVGREDTGFYMSEPDYAIYDMDTDEAYTSLKNETGIGRDEAEITRAFEYADGNVHIDFKEPGSGLFSDDRDSLDTRTGKIPDDE